MAHWLCVSIQGTKPIPIPIVVSPERRQARADRKSRQTIQKAAVTAVASPVGTVDISGLACLFPHQEARPKLANQEPLTDIYRGVRPDDRTGKWTDPVAVLVREGHRCFYCLLPTEGTDMACSTKQCCDISFHVACYLQHWGPHAEGSRKKNQFNKCPRRHCLVCSNMFQKADKVVGCCETCGADCHLSCAGHIDYYCIACNSAMWPPKAKAS